MPSQGACWDEAPATCDPQCSEVSSLSRIPALLPGSPKLLWAPTPLRCHRHHLAPTGQGKREAVAGGREEGKQNSPCPSHPWHEEDGRERCSGALSWGEAREGHWRCSAGWQQGSSAVPSRGSRWLDQCCHHCRARHCNHCPCQLPGHCCPSPSWGCIQSCLPGVHRAFGLHLSLPVQPVATGTGPRLVAVGGRGGSASIATPLAGWGILQSKDKSPSNPSQALRPLLPCAHHAEGSPNCPPMGPNPGTGGWHMGLHKNC